SFVRLVLFAADLSHLLLSYRLSILSYLFFLILLRPPSSPLFPYTTLFRSLPRYLPSRWRLAPRRGAARFLPARCSGRQSRHPPSDRKSTRLNSSHQIISYAVFCLKKKKSKRHSTY